MPRCSTVRQGPLQPLQLPQLYMKEQRSMLHTQTRSKVWARGRARGLAASNTRACQDRLSPRLQLRGVR
jgi:hypothetical protein